MVLYRRRRRGVQSGFRAGVSPLVLFLTILTLLPAPGAAAPAAATGSATGVGRLGLEFHGGLPALLSTRLDIRQEGRPDLSLDPTFRTEPLTFPIYYAWRLSLARGDHAWAIDLLHNKLILDGPHGPAGEVHNFEITHGYNILTLQHLWLREGFHVAAGVGFVVAHPENRVRDQDLSEETHPGGTGYRWTGPALVVGLGRRFPLGRHVFLSLEGRLIHSRANVPVAHGEADVRELSAHLLAGLGGSF